LDGVGEFDVEIFDIRTDANNNTTYVVGNVVGAIAAEAENALPQSPIRLGPEEALAKGDKNRNMEDGVGSELMKLQPVHEKQSTKKIMDRSREAENEVVNEANPIFHRGRWVALLAGEAQGVLLLRQAELLHQIDILV
jgi:hypothetical protein